MKRSWQATREALTRDRRGQPLPPEAFWDDFRARARLRVQVSPEATNPMIVPWRNRWAWAGTCAVVCFAIVGIRFMGGSPAAEASQINSVEVIASHSGVLIMNDDSSKSAILWIVDMEAGEDDGGSS